VPDLDEIVDFGVASDASFADSRAIDRGVATHLNAIFKHRTTRLFHFEPTLCRGDEAKSFSTDNHTAMNDAIGTEATAFVDRAVGV
jgi:hypothetical protein